MNTHITINSFIINKTSWERWNVSSQTFTTDNLNCLTTKLDILNIKNVEHSLPGENHYEPLPTLNTLTINIYTWCNDRNTGKKTILADKNLNILTAKLGIK